MSKIRSIAIIFSVLPVILLLLAAIKNGNHIEWYLLFFSIQIIGSFVSKKYFYIVGIEYFIFGIMVFSWIAFPGYDSGRYLFLENDYIRFFLASLGIGVRSQFRADHSRAGGNPATFAFLDNLLQEMGFMDSSLRGNDGS